MNLAAQIAKNFREVHFGKNWTFVNLKDTLADVTWEQATAKVDSSNTIAALVYHMNFYVTAVMKVLKGGPLDSHDKHSFDVPPIQSKEDWDQLTRRVFSEAEEFARLIEELPESTFGEDFAGGKYGNYYRNFHGIIEHTHYHLGQIVMIKKMLQSR